MMMMMMTTQDDIEGFSPAAEHLDYPGILQRARDGTSTAVPGKLVLLPCLPIKPTPLPCSRAFVFFARTAAAEECTHWNDDEKNRSSSLRLQENDHYVLETCLSHVGSVAVADIDGKR